MLVPATTPTAVAALGEPKEKPPLLGTDEDQEDVDIDVDVDVD